MSGNFNPVPSDTGGGMDKALFNQFRKVIYDKSGITLNDTKMALVKARVARRLRALKIPNEKEYLKFLLQDESGNEMISFLDAVSTNLTRFYREPMHFECLFKYLKQWHGEGQRKFRIWSAASSTGEEPYTIMFTVMRAMDISKVDFRMLATDISTDVLQKAIHGVYSEKDLQSVPDNIKGQYMHRVAGGTADSGQLYQVNDNLRDRISYNRLNLNFTPYPMKGPFDFVFCRNVMIYFDNELRKRLLMEIHRTLRPDGILFIGLSETLNNLDLPFKLIEAGTYVKV